MQLMKNRWLTTMVLGPRNIFLGMILSGSLDCLDFCILLLYKQALGILDMLLIIRVLQNVSV